MQNLPGTLFSIGLSCLFGTILIFWVIAPRIVDWQITKLVKLEEGNEVWTAWADIQAEIHFKVYVYNVTNPDEIAAGANPIVQELGPYVYEEKRHKVGIRTNLENDTISYQPRVMYYFRADLSNGTEEDVLTMINVPLVAVGNELDTWPRMIRYMAKYYLQSFEESLFVQRTVKLALFEGVHVEMLEEISSLLGREFMPNNTFGYLSEKNMTDPWEIEISAGIKDHTQFGETVSWKGEKNMKIWGGDECNMLNGTDTTIFAPFITKDTIIQVFEPDICRSVHLTFHKEDQYDGIKGYRFSLPKNIFSDENPDNKCFCAEEDKSKCAKSGAVSISACKWGAPLLISKPHFLNADPKYVEDVKGVNPNASIHDSFVIIEPNTGMILKGSKRIQFNIHVKKSKDITDLYKVPDVVLPLFWISEEAVQAPREVNMARNRLIIPLTIIEVGKWSLLALSSVLTVAAVLIFMLRTRSRKPVEYY